MKPSINCFFPLVLLFLEPSMFFGNCEIADQTDLGEGKVNLWFLQDHNGTATKQNSYFWASAAHYHKPL